MARITKSPSKTKAELIKAATKLFATKGLADTAVSDIVREAGVAQGTFYLYFKSKEEIINEIVDAIAARITARLLDAVESRELTALEKLLVLTEEAFSDLIGDSELMRHFHREENRRAHDYLNDELAANLVPLIEEIIRQGVGEGVFYTPYPDKAALFVFGSALLINEKMIAEGGPVGPWKIAALDFALRGLKCDPQIISSTIDTLSAELVSANKSS